ncbi:hypothetical protein AGMMS50276_28540 [Synergistales bacterium]|nr:hypothetical protein AGMMS50276_28540 [Synergistales bacterium]
MTGTEATKASRATLEDKAKTSTVRPRLLSVDEAAVMIGISVNTLNSLRTETPKRYTKETFDAAVAKGRIPPPPYVKLGNSVRYDTRDIDMWIDRLPHMGDLPKEEIV